MEKNISDECVAVVGMGYVGLPLALAFGRVMPTIGFDISEDKINAYRQGFDPTGEMENELFIRAQSLKYTYDPSLLEQADYIIVAVPTPVDNAHQPDLTPVIRASETVGRHMRKGVTVVFESTVYPGVTEDVCVPILEQESSLKCGVNFSVGYSPERVNPGDREHRLAQSIRVAEAAKVIENTQRDANIALVNELALIFHKLGIDTQAVLDAAGTKWNFLPFRPGLVGGHCIGVDPYYLTHRAEIAGFRPEMIKASRYINDGMGRWLAEQTVMEMIRAGIQVKGSNVVILGLTFKENCADLRNTKVIDCIRELEPLGINVRVCDPVANAKDAKREYDIELVDMNELQDMDAVILAVAHTVFQEMDRADFFGRCRKGAPIMDVKCMLDPEEVCSAGLSLWRL